MKTHWRLPRGVDELLPPSAWRLELLRREVLDLFVSWGFEYLELPVIEYLDALLVGSGEDLDLQTLKVVDQVSGRQLGVRADMTSQAVRVDAHSRMLSGVQRLCYAGPVVFANPEIAHESRVPIKAGAEIFGAPSLAADAEMIQLMLETMTTAGIEEPVLLIGHMGIYRGLVDALLAAGDLNATDENRLFKRVQRKSDSDVAELLADTALAGIMANLPRQMQEVDRQHQQLVSIRRALDGAPAEVLVALDELQALVGMVFEACDCQSLRVDVAELSGYGYHNGPVFAVYHPTAGSALAQGGRYDGIGEVFGRARPATGFDVNLKNLVGTEQSPNTVVFAPLLSADHDESRKQTLKEEIRALRAGGTAVWCALSADEKAGEGMRELTWVDGEWRVQ